MIKVIAFDIGGVYFRFHYNKYLLAMQKITHMSKTKISVADKKLLRELHVLDVTEKQRWNAFCEEIGMRMPLALFKKVNDDNLMKPNKAVIAIARRLRRNYKTAIVANQTPVLDRLDKKWGIYKNFDYNLSSHIVKLQKPDPAIFKLLLRMARVKSSEVLFIDDQQKNVDAARKLGIKVILYKNAKQLRSDLRKLRVLP